MTKARLCETVTGQTMAELRAARDRAVVGDLVELRLDGVRDVEVAGALAGRRGPVVVTCRAAWEGGRFDGSEEERHRLLTQAIDLGADYVDVEWKAGFADLVAKAPARIVVSHHDFEGTPRDLADRATAMRATGATTIKLAVTPARLTDTLRLKAVGEDGGAVVVGMGPMGVATRLLPDRFCSLWSYGGSAAPGQIPAERMVEEFRFRDVGPDTRLFGVVSQTAMHSLSPTIHNAALADAAIDAVYVPLQTEDFDDFLTFATGIGLEGVSVTIPFKLDALRAAHTCEGMATEVGAANTLRRRGTQWEATNTDVDGFLAPLRQLMTQHRLGRRASVLGAGGSARAVCAALRHAGFSVTVHARRSTQARELATTLGCAVGPWPPPHASWDVLVNTTPLGGANQRHLSPLPDAPLDGQLVYDLTYGDGDSALLTQARANGRLVLDGLPMLVAQAERQFEWWVGREPRAGLMRSAAQSALARGAGEPRRDVSPHPVATAAIRSDSSE